jgi:EAL domain-containing protein (putative c-di-GMP-specific phosphodiesterase class I)/GGDEF domain-containing protein
MSGRATTSMAARQSSAESLRHLRLERDRHVAFAFAAADLLIEVSNDGKIIAAAGAAQAILGVSIPGLTGKPILDFVAAADRPLARRLLKHVHAQLRIDPVVVELVRGDGVATSTLFGACRLPDRNDSVFLSVAQVPCTLASLDRPRDAATGLLTADALRAAGQRLAVDDGSAARQLEFVRLDGLSGAVRHLSDDRAQMLMHEIGAALRACSIGGDAAGRLTEDSFGIVSKASNDPAHDAALVADLADAIRGAGIPDGQVSPRIAKIDLSLGRLTDKEAGLALTYAMTSFAKSLGGSLDIGSLQSGLSAAMRETVSRFVDTRRILTDERFTLVYQPVVDITTRAIHHYEALTRFADGADTFETVVFSEDVGLIMDLDLAVCGRAIKAMERSDNASVAVNLSGRSVQNDAFRGALIELVQSLGNLRHRLLFELTESAAVVNMAEAEAFLSQLRTMGHPVCLDDFGAGAAAYSYLRRFDVDFVKIDGPFLKAARDQQREQALIRSICVLCKELGCNVIGEMIEDERVASLAASLGVGYGQGWLFGKPAPELPWPVKSIRRKGGVETWQ